MMMAVALTATMMTPVITTTMGVSIGVCWSTIQFPTLISLARESMSPLQ